MECYVNDNYEITFTGRSMDEANNELLESIYYPEGRKEPVNESEKNDEKITYSELLKEHKYSRNNISYQSLLLTKEWAQKRDKIIKRDKERCTKCLKGTTDFHPFNTFSFSEKNWTGHFWIEDSFGLKQYEKYETGEGELMDETGFMDYRAIIIADKQYYLQVHHKYYIVDKNPWDYNDNDLITLCNWCHWEFHENNTVKVYIERESQLVERAYTLCSRCNGMGNLPQYSHVSGGVCFKCGGQRYFLI